MTSLRRNKQRRKEVKKSQRDKKERKKFLTPFPVGDRVRVDLGNRPTEGQVTEDRGPIGVGGQRLDVIVDELGEGNLYEIFHPTAEIELIEPKMEPA